MCIVLFLFCCCETHDDTDPTYVFICGCACDTMFTLHGKNYGSNLLLKCTKKLIGYNHINEFMQKYMCNHISEIQYSKRDREVRSSTAADV